MREMKDSGIEWIGKIPTGWDVTLFKKILIRNDGGLWGNDPNGKDDILVLRSTEQTIDGKWDILFPAYRDLSNVSNIQEYLIKCGDLLITKSSGSDFHIGKTTIADEYIESLRCSFSNFIQRLRVCSKMNPRYYWYILNSSIARGQFVYLQNSTSGIGNINSKNINEIKVPIPPFDTQCTIVNHLDRKCSQIDAIIAKQQDVIEKLKEYKLSVITEAVTKGLNPDVPMKDSGIEWIGKIPEHWNIIKLARIINSTQNGLTRRNLDKSDGQIVLKLKNISANGEISYEYQNRIELTEKELNTYSLSDGDFLFVRVNGSKSLVGKCAVFHSIGETVAYNDHIIRVKISNYCIERFLLYYLLSSSGKTEIDLHTSTAAGQYTISGEGLRDVYLTLPLKDEQKQIVNYLDNKCEQIDFTITKKQKLIEKLTDYKKSLVYEVVTGKKEV